MRSIFMDSAIDWILSLICRKVFLGNISIPLRMDFRIHQICLRQVLLNLELFSVLIVDCVVDIHLNGQEMLGSW